MRRNIIDALKKISNFGKLIAISIFTLLVLMVALQTTDGADSRPIHSEASDMLCYMVTSKGKVIDLMHLCKERIPTNLTSASQSPTFGVYPQIARGPQSYANYKGALSYPSPPNIYNYQAMNNFDNQLYGN
ncbi:hypothetical protein [Pseudanabaena minima]|uniref:hypothetical protein n=1 Tax=Pseudanabaena minima TaxID=890415 RepID=UPI003DA91CCA